MPNKEKTLQVVTPAQTDSGAEIVDKVFDNAEPASDFKFSAETAQVFDDMVSRSVPFYDETQRMIQEIVSDFATPNSKIYDLGCSTATTFAALDPLIDQSVRFVGIDNAAPMLAKARAKLESRGVTRPYELIDVDLHDLPEITDASVVIMNLTLQFVRPLRREKLMRNIADGLNKQGCLLLVEKVTVEDSRLNRLYIDYYYEMKRRHGYSELEISGKREALENVLIPYRLSENEALLREVGFSTVEVFFRWYNFCGILAVK